MSLPLSIAPDVVALTNEDGLVVMHRGTGRILFGNPTSARLWRRLADGASNTELAADLATRFGVSSERAAADVRGFIDALAGHGVIVNEGRQ